MLRFTKGYKDLNNKDEVRFIDPLDKQGQNAMCLVKLLMIVALRFGHMQGGNSLKEPIICQIPIGKQLPVQEPGGAHIADRSVKNLALVGGVLGHVSSHTVCYRTIRDSAYIKQKIQGVAKSAVTVGVGHTEQAKASRLT
ncbi:hypothetical protein B0J14DRAFT_657284 [Halenospora varia]|nr:hypothetical protein B0J14DRAFT_657284 [Halenospora varia]